MFWLGIILLTKEKIKRGEWRWLCKISPNIICIARTILVGIGLLLYAHKFFLLGILLIILGFLGDMLDGIIARGCQKESLLGEFLDPLADKISCLMIIGYFHSIIYYFIFWSLVIVETGGQFLGRFFSLIRRGDIKARLSGKIKFTVLSSAAIYLLIWGAKFTPLPFLGNELLIMGLILAIISAGEKIIPPYWYANVLSLANLACGLAACYFIKNNNPLLMFMLIIGGQLFDVIDGHAARLFGSPPIGKWLDDAGDFVSFGLAPAFFLATKFPELNFLAVIFLAAILFRLLRFALKEKKEEKEHFWGLPSPAAGILTMALVFLIKNPIILLSIETFIIFLTVSKVPFSHGKNIWRPLSKKTKITLASLIILFLAWVLKYKETVILAAAIASGLGMYIIISFILMIIRRDNKC